MARANRNQRRSYRPEGEIRRSQLLMGYGPGAMVDLLNDAVMIGGLDYWRYESSRHGVTPIEEPRLTAKLVETMRGLGMKPANNLVLQPPPECTSEDATPRQGIQALEFPRYFKCQRCNTVAHAAEFEESSKRGREARGSGALDTRVKLLELVRGAKESVFWAGYHFDDRTLVEPLYETMCKRPLDVTMVLEVKSDSKDGRSKAERIRVAIDRFFGEVWVWQDIRPRVYIDPRTAG